jgi:type II secretory pathway component GspD/PulD (secretin)
MAVCQIHAAVGQHALEIIPLRHATVDQVLPALRALLEPEATLTGQSNQLIVRASPGNIAEIKQALEVIDRPRKRLEISVRFDDSLDASDESLSASGRIGNRGARVEIGARDERSSAQERVDQRLQVLEGSRAFISTGQSRTLPQRQVIRTPGGVISQDTFVVQETATGFEVAPRLAGDRVMLDISPQRQSFSDSTLPGGVSSQGTASTISAPLGQWVEIGAAVSNAARDDRGLASASRSRSAASRKIWVKVEESREGSRN